MGRVWGGRDGKSEFWLKNAFADEQQCREKLILAKKKTAFADEQCKSKRLSFACMQSYGPFKAFSLYEVFLGPCWALGLSLAFYPWSPMTSIPKGIASVVQETSFILIRLHVLASHFSNKQHIEQFECCQLFTDR